MMAYKYLHELLKEDQEPFQLKSYISDKRCQLRRTNNPRTTLQIKKRKQIISEKSSTPSKRSFCKHACFLSFQGSPDVRKSSFFDFPSPAGQKSPLRNGGVLLHVPAKTAALLFEAAMRVQNHQKNSKEKTERMSGGFGILGSILKRLKDRNKNKNMEIRDSIIEFEDSYVEEEMRRSGCCNNSRLSSSGGWSESNEKKSLDLDSCYSCNSGSEDSLEEAFAAYEKRFCLSPFRFSLHRSPLGNQTPDLFSPTASPSRQNGKKQDQTEGTNMALEDEKEQCSPVSVLETRFEADGDDVQQCGDKEEYEDDDYYDYGDNECDNSYAIVQKAKEHLLDKLRRFEKMAELDPIELEKRMIEEMEEEKYQDDEPTSLGRDIGHNLDTVMLTEVLSQASFQQSWKFPMHMERLVSDLITEEKRQMIGLNDNDLMVATICKKLNSWKEVQPHTIDMMVELDFVREYASWKKYEEQSGEIARDIEVAIFRVLVDELAEELCY